MSTTGLIGTLSAQPSLSRSMPGALQPGIPTEVTLFGEGLQSPLQIWSSSKVQFGEIKPASDQKSATVTITADADCLLGRMGIVVRNAAGISDPLLILMDDLPSVQESESNHTVEQAQPISLPVAVDGRCSGGAADYYRFHAKRGETVSIEVFAQRVASLMDPIVRLLDATGRELRLADDDRGLGADCRLRFRVPETAEFVLEVRDNRFRSGERYRLRIGDFPIVSTTLPLGGRRGSTTRFRLVGLNAADIPPFILPIPPSLSYSQMEIGIGSGGGESSTMARIAMGDLPELLEAEPNDALGQATSLTIPCAVSGELQRSNDVDYYQFAAVKGQRLRLTGQGRRFGSPAYVYMTLYGPDGRSVGEPEVLDGEELTFSFELPAQGVYRLAARDLSYRGGPNFSYRIVIQSGPDFSLMLKNDKSAFVKSQLPSGDGVLGLTVVAERHGYDGPIQLALEAPDAGLRLCNHTIPAKAKQARFYLRTTPQFQANGFGLIRLVGAANIQGRPVHRGLHTEQVLRTKLPQLLYPPGWYDGLIAVSSGAPAKRLFSVQSDQPSVVMAQGKGEFVFHVSREEPAQVTVLAEDLPAGFQFSVKSDKDEYTATLATVDSSTGTVEETEATSFTLRLLLIGEHSGRGQLLTHEVPVHVKSG